MSDQGLNDIAI